MRRNERSLEPFFAVGLLLMLVESWFHSDPGQHLQAPLRRLLRLFRSGPPVVAKLAGEDARPSLQRSTNPLRPLEGEEKASGSESDLPSDLVDAPAQAPPDEARLAMPKHEKPQPAEAKPKAASAEKRAPQRPRETPSVPAERKRSERASAAETSSSKRGVVARSDSGSSAQRASGRGARFAPPNSRSDVASAVRALRKRLSGEPDWDGGRGSRGSPKAPVSASRDSAKAPKAPASAKEKQSQDRARREKSRRAPAMHPVVPTVRALLGSGPLKPPSGELRPPNFVELIGHTPDLMGRLSLPNAQQLERLSPPIAQDGYREWLAQDGKAGPSHWHSAGDVRYLHEGTLWAAEREGRRAPMVQSQGHWWSLAEGEQPLVWNEGHWWWQKDGVWFLLHDGQPWAFRWFADWESEGLLNTRNGTRIVYSADESKAAVSASGEDPVVFDLRTGEEVAAKGSAQDDSASRRPPARRR